MSLLDQAIADVRMFATGEFSQALVLTDLNGQQANVKALNNKIGRKLESDTGIIVNTDNATVVISEAALKSANSSYSIRNSGNQVAMIGHKVAAPDSNGTSKKYIVLQNIPDETIGLITLMLGNYEP